MNGKENKRNDYGIIFTENVDDTDDEYALDIEDRLKEIHDTLKENDISILPKSEEEEPDENGDEKIANESKP